MREILRITFALTISCLIAATVMGAVFTITNEAKKRNEHRNMQRTMISLLGYSRSSPPPSTLKLHTIYRYILNTDKGTLVAYLLPVERETEERYDLIVMDLEGNFSRRYPLDLTPEEALETPERNGAVQSVLESGETATYADSAIIAQQEGKRVAYLLPGEFPGFKTFIEVMLALDPSFSVIGLEIMEHEEDPGLGGDIERPYFKNQFDQMTFEEIKESKVVKEPMPERYRRYLEAEGQRESLFTREELEEIRSTYQDEEIYSLTGATISSRAVTTGVKNMVKKFAYRIDTLEQVLDQQEIPAQF